VGEWPSYSTKPDLSSNGCRGSLHQTLMVRVSCCIRTQSSGAQQASLRSRVANEAVIDHYYRSGPIVRVIVDAVAIANVG